MICLSFGLFGLIFIKVVRPSTVKPQPSNPDENTVGYFFNFVSFRNFFSACPLNVITVELRDSELQSGQFSNDQILKQS